MPFAVRKYQDTYTERKKPAPGSTDANWQLGRFDWFDTEDEAKAFILDRAFRGVKEAEKALDLATNRHKRCAKKFIITAFAANSGEKTT